jgi:hypothetical protein
VVVLMRDRGLSLHLSHERPLDRWWLSDGTRVAPEAAETVIKHPDIVGVGDGLFARARAQSYRHI